MTAVVPTEPIGGGLPVVWVLLVTLGARVPTDASLGGGMLGTVAGFWAFAILVGWSFVAFAIGTIALLAILAGVWVAYERSRWRGDSDGPPYGTRRHVFVLLDLASIAVVLLLAFA